MVGDYATVFQSFTQSPPSIASFIRSAQFRALVDDRTKGFVGREFVFEEIRRVLGGAEFASGYVVIRGEPGIGKTAVAASLVVSGGYVHHFNIAPENIRSAGQFLQNVCAQLIVRYGLEHATLPPQAAEDAGFMSQVLAEAADVARRQGDSPVVVVVDALDEAEDTALPAAANRLYLPRALPEGVFFVLTTREEADYRWTSTIRPRYGSGTTIRPTAGTSSVSSRGSWTTTRMRCGLGWPSGMSARRRSSCR